MRTTRLPVLIMLALAGCSSALMQFPPGGASGLDPAIVASLEKEVSIEYRWSRLPSANHNVVGSSCQNWAWSDPPKRDDALNSIRHQASKIGANEVFDVVCAANHPNYLYCWKSITCSGTAIPRGKAP